MEIQFSSPETIFNLMNPVDKGKIKLPDTNFNHLKVHILKQHYYIK